MKAQLKAVEHLLYPVEIVPSKDLLPDHIFTPQQEFSVIVKTPDGDKIVNTCSKQYHLASNREIVESLAKSLEGFDFEIKGQGRWDSRFTFDFIIKDKTFKVKSGKDLIAPKLRVHNSYDGRVKYSFVMGFFRFICTNGIVMPVKGFEDVNRFLKMRHTPSLEEIINPQEILEMTTNFIDQGKKLIKPFEELAKKKVDNLEERVEEVISETKFSSRRAEDVLDRIQKEMKILEAPTPNDWLVYSGMNYQLNHSRDIKMDTHKREKVDEQVLTYLLEN